MPVLRNAKHEHFAQLIAKGATTPPKAYVIAGYSDKGAAQSANRLLRDAEVSARIEELREAIEKPSRERAIEKAAVDKAWVLSQLVEVVQMAKQAEPVRDAEGAATGEYKQNLAAANKALELVGKELGMFVDRKEVRTGELDALPHDDIKQVRDALIALANDPAAGGPVTGRSGSTTH